MILIVWRLVSILCDRVQSGNQNSLETKYFSFDKFKSHTVRVRVV
jgi:hypothetical protein